jgi:hypothetical protein
MSTSENTFPKIEPLTAVNYQTWKDDVEYILLKKKLWNIVSGNELYPPTLAAPSPAGKSADTPSTSATIAPTATTAEQIQWLERAGQAMGIIGRLMTKNLRHLIKPYTKDPAGAWKLLHTKYGKPIATNLV